MTGVEELETRIAELKAQPLALNLTRGLPADEQVALSAELRSLSAPPLEVIFNDGSVMLMSVENAANAENVKSKMPIFNYGGMPGLASARELMSPLLQVPRDQIIMGGTSSLILMGHVLEVLWAQGAFEGDTPWGNAEEVKFLCPVPGYDRHHDRLELLGIKMIPVPILEDGPDMDMVEDLVKNDASIKGMWAIPTFSNPTGTIYSKEVIARLNSMETAYPGFRILVDDAYAVHSMKFGGLGIQGGIMVTIPRAGSFVAAAEEAGNPDRPIVFASTSKITIPGAGICGLGTSKGNIAHLLKWFSLMGIAIGDKVNQAQHVMFLKDFDTVVAHMQKLGRMIQPKCSATIETLKAELGEDGEFAEWTEPDGGYFISVYTKLPIASDVVALCKELGVQLTGAGAAFPYKKDPDNSHLRIAFTFPQVEDVKKAMKVVCTAIKYLTLKSA